MSLIEKNSPYILGIDLGTSNSAVSVYRKGKPEMIKIGREWTLPSVVSFRSEEDIQVGETAKRRILLDPEHTVSFIKREMGTEWSKEFYGKTYKPEDISAEILTKLVESCQSQEEIDLRGTPKFAVICIPANFDDNKKRATRTAAELAGLEVLYLLEEPVAAAIAYGTEVGRDQTILVYDLGGGTFDASVLKVESTEENEPAKFTILSKEGNPKLGGVDIDRILMEKAAQHFEEQSSLRLFDLEADQGLASTDLMQAQQKLQEACEEAKKELSQVEHFTIEIPNFIKDEYGTVHNLEYEITREDFEQAISGLIDISMETVQKALDNSQLTIHDISRIILVGGSTRIPLVKSKIKELFNKEPYSNLDADTVVAQGAAIYGASLGVPSDKLEESNEVDEEDVPDTEIEMNNIVTHHLGLELNGGRFDLLIEKGNELTDEVKYVEIEKVYTTSTDNMTELRFSVFQSADKVNFVSDDGAVWIGEFFLTGIPAAPKGKHRIPVKFQVNQENEVIISASLEGDQAVANTLTIQRS